MGNGGAGNARVALARPMETATRSVRSSERITWGVVENQVDLVLDRALGVVSRAESVRNRLVGCVPTTEALEQPKAPGGSEFELAVTKLQATMRALAAIEACLAEILE